MAGPVYRKGGPPGARLEENVGECDAERILGAGAGGGAEVREAEGLGARLVVAVLEPPDEAAPDLVLDGRGDPVEVDVVPGRGDPVPHALGVGEVLDPERGAERLGPIVGRVAGNAAPRRGLVLAGAERDEDGVIGVVTSKRFRRMKNWVLARCRVPRGNF